MRSEEKSEKKSNWCRMKKPNEESSMKKKTKPYGGEENPADPWTVDSEEVMSQDTAIRIPPVYGGNWTTSSQKMASTWPWAIQLALLRGGDIDMCSYAHLFPKPSRPQVVTRHVE